MSDSLTIIPVAVDVPVKSVLDVIITAAEYACAYWAVIVAASELPANLSYYERFFNIATDGWIDFSLLEEMETSSLGFGLTQKIGTKTMRLNNNTIQNGLKLMANKYPRHFGDLMCNNHDADTADVFLQCCLLGDIIYG